MAKYTVIIAGLPYEIEADAGVPSLVGDVVKFYKNGEYIAEFKRERIDGIIVEGSDVRE